MGFIGKRLDLVCDSETQLNVFQFNVNFLDDQKLARALFRTCEHCEVKD